MAGEGQWYYIRPGPDPLVNAESPQTKLADWRSSSGLSNETRKTQARVTKWCRVELTMYERSRYKAAILSLSNLELTFSRHPIPIREHVDSVISLRPADPCLDADGVEKCCRKDCCPDEKVILSDSSLHWRSTLPIALPI